MIIRDANESDLNRILEIYNFAVLNTTAVYDYEPRTLEAQLHWFKNKKNSTLPILVAEESKTIVGFCSYGPFRTWPAYSNTVEWSVYIDNAYWGKGIASQLLQNLITIAKSQKLHTIIAGIDSSNEASVKLHKKLGFTEVGYLREVGWKFGRWLDLTFLQLII